MATSANETISFYSPQIGVVRLALIDMLAAIKLYTLCWLGARLGFGTGTHRNLSRFTGDEISRGSALIGGVSWAIAFGPVAGTLDVRVYNSLASPDRR